MSPLLDYIFVMRGGLGVLDALCVCLGMGSREPLPADLLGNVQQFMSNESSSNPVFYGKYAVFVKVSVSTCAALGVHGKTGRRA
ncbi:MAG: hypothetical protein KDB03_15725 [Planctomycetales bacterium]|nr:hypothetical protein [Planctomycetales bacterium]